MPSSIAYLLCAWPPPLLNYCVHALLHCLLTVRMASSIAYLLCACPPPLRAVLATLCKVRCDKGTFFSAELADIRVAGFACEVRVVMGANRCS
eukprot:1365401-Pyramimonas_sp.AAC.1